MKPTPTEIQAAIKVLNWLIESCPQCNRTLRQWVAKLERLL